MPTMSSTAATGDDAVKAHRDHVGRGQQALLWSHRRIDIARLANDLPGSLWSYPGGAQARLGVTSAAKASFVLGHL